MDTRHIGPVAARLVDSYLEIVPVPGIEDRLVGLPDQAYIAITCSPTKGVEPTIALAERLASRRLKLVPHIAARMVRDGSHLQEILQRLEQAEIESVFIPGGDAPKPLGIYASSLELLRAMAEIGHTIKDVGVAAHPEGHAMMSKAEMVNLLLEKQAHATYLVTQMCFDPGVLIRWLNAIRNAGVTLPAWIGLPGVVNYARLLQLSMRIGVGQSVRWLRRQRGLLKKLVDFRPYRPDELLQGLAPHLEEGFLDIPGFHLFSFNDIERTERWRQDALAKYRRVA